MGNWLLSMAGSAAGAAALLAIGGFLFRSQLLHLLNKDLEEVKARHQRELEAYKVSLIAEGERTKANLDVRKAMALRIADAKFSAIHKLHEDGYSVAAKAVSIVKIYRGAEIDVRHNQRDSLMECLMNLDGAIDLASPFLAADEVEVHRDFIFNVGQFLDRLSPEVVNFPDGEFEQRKGELMAQQIKCTSIVKLHLSSMFSIE